jgi:5'-deoxynucleotidase YfbR-like HD superfamily hydrolase
MYQFSRSIYRELSEVVATDPRTSVVENKQRLLHSCEAALERLANDRHYFARPARTLFNEVRTLFPLDKQMRVYSVIESHMRLAADYVDMCARHGESLTGAPLVCHATTRRGTPCQREPLPGSRYCPSHKHLDTEFEVATAA